MNPDQSTKIQFEKLIVFEKDLPDIDYYEAARTKILATNGTSKVTVLNRADWSNIYTVLQKADDRQDRLLSYYQLFQEARKSMDTKNIYPIMILDYNFKYHIDDSDSQSPEYGRTFSSNILSRTIVGDEIDFIIPDQFLLTNTDQKYKIEIDFDNGDGFIPIDLNTIHSVNYVGERKEFLEMVVRASRNNEDYIYSHFTLRRKSSHIVPTVKRVKNFDVMRSEPNSNHEFTWYDSESGNSLTATILYGNNQNGANKLRRPIIVTDGFDPDDNRNYAMNNSSSDQDKVDERGLYELVNGDPSHWESESSPNFADDLLNDGYDIVFVNFESGADDIIENGKAFKNFLNIVINGSTYRDRKTEMSIIVGPSMGGLITRYALAKLEEDDIPHFTKSWVAFDSPMKGAYIPISVQYAVEFMYDWTFGLKEAIAEAKVKLESTAAQQILLSHFDSYASTIHNTFYNTMLYLGYPNLVKRYAITNGGKNRMFPSTPVGNYENILFRLKFQALPLMYGNSMHNTNSSTSYRLFRGQGSWGATDKYVNNNIAYDGAVGGYNTALYAVNGDNASNALEKDPDNSANFRYMKATFIPTPSALGFEVTPGNVFDSWEDFSVSSSPFDEFFGMEDNEEHVNISQATATRVIDIFRDDFDEGILPFNRNGNSDIVFDKPVAFTHKSTATFGGNGNTVEFKDGVESNIRATDLIKFESGVTIKQGAEISAMTEPVNYATVFRSSNARPGLDPLATSKTRGKVYNHGENEVADQLEFKLSPNPAVDFVKLENTAKEEITFGIYRVTGEMVEKIIISAKTTQRINISHLSPGNYFIKNFSDSSIGKFIKIK
ncbi:hypothetical protein GCM10007940_11030 [Portibacter lacus]|uniref:Secretion system C-terminal sorting domain-containing protein n=1 Tax=Portibacter lacus TaxID=1099794 RepID=A0AA37SPV2_9BACT|nr:hypothetical protein GCM10007940_11030 [Portibacter lacus]